MSARGRGTDVLQMVMGQLMKWLLETSLEDKDLVAPTEEKSSSQWRFWKEKEVDSFFLLSRPFATLSWFSSLSAR